MPRRTLIRLSEGVNIPLKIDATLRRRGPPSCGQLRLGEPRNMERGLFGSLRRTTPPRWRWTTPRLACGFLRPVFVDCFGSVSWPNFLVIVACFVGHWVTCLSVSLLG